MSTEVIPIGTGAANSADITVVAGTPVNVFLKDAAGPEIQPGAKVFILQKDDAGQYFRIGDLRSGVRSRAAVLFGPGIYRLTRAADSVAVGVSRD